MKKLLKFIFFSFGVLLIICIGFYKFYEYKFNQNVKNDDLNIFISEIKNSENLTEKFYELYEKEYPKSLDYGYVSSTFENTKCQSRILSRRIYPVVKKQNSNRIENLTFEYFLAKKIEQNASQKQCLNWIAKTSDFLYNTKGIENASKFYFKAEFKNLDEQKTETLIKMLESPTKYNPIRN